MKMQIKTEIIFATIFYALLVDGIFLSGCIEKSAAGSVNFTSEPSGAEIWIDGLNTQKVTPSTIFNLKEGTHTYTLRKEGYVTLNNTFYVKANQTVEQSLNIQSLNVSASPGVQISWANLPKENISAPKGGMDNEKMKPYGIDNEKINDLKNQSYMPNQSYEPSVNVTIQNTEDTSH